jgi:hypothetical protein
MSCGKTYLFFRGTNNEKCWLKDLTVSDQNYWSKGWPFAIVRDVAHALGLSLVRVPRMAREHRRGRKMEAFEMVSVIALTALRD